MATILLNPELTFSMKDLAVLIFLFALYNLTLNIKRSFPLSVCRPTMTADAEFILGVVLILAVFFGVLGNIAVTVSICRTGNLLRNNHYYLLVHLAICDLLYLVFFTEIIYNIFSANAWITSNQSYFVCKIWWPIHTLVFTVGPNILVIISLVRYRATVHPFKPAVSRRNLKILLTFVYVSTIICIIPYVLVLKFDRTIGCHEEWPLESLNSAYTILLACVQYFIPAALLSIIYFKICKNLVTQNNRTRSMNARNQVGQRSSRAAATWFQRLTLQNTKNLLVCFTIVTCFTVSAGPMQVIAIVYAISSRELPSYDLWLQAFYMFGTVVLNPFVYGALDKRVFSLFKHCRKKMENKTTVVPR